MAYLFIPIGLLFLGLSVLDARIAPSAGLHALTGGAFGVMPLAVMARASLGHTGQPLSVDHATLAIFAAILAAVMIRIAEGLRPAGFIQVNTARAGGKRCDMDVQILPEGQVFRISQSLGPGARGCHLDPGGRESAISAVRADLADQRPNILIVNKLGKHEAEGRGFATLIADVLEAGAPVLVGVNGLNREAFARYAGGIATLLDPDIATVQAWLQGVTPLGQATLWRSTLRA